MFNKFEIYVEAYLDQLRKKNLSAATVSLRKYCIKNFVTFLCAEDIQEPQDSRLNLGLFEKYFATLYTRKAAGARPISKTRVSAYIATLKAFFTYLSRQNYILFNPIAEVTLPKRERVLPKSIFTESEVRKIISKIEPQTKFATRDLAIIETFYSTGMRQNELRNLRISDLDFERGVVFIREGKGKKERVVPIGESAMNAINHYVERSRNLFIKMSSNSELLFYDYTGSAVTRVAFAAIVKKYKQKAAIEKVGSTHALRHACATHMLENGASVRYVQELLGHSLISTTQIYTQVTISKLKAAYEKYNNSND